MHGGALWGAVTVMGKGQGVLASLNIQIATYVQHISIFGTFYSGLP
jgi:hypothetical protein